MTTLNLAGAGVQVFSNLSMAGSLVPVRALVVVHGTNRNVADYQSYGVAAAKAAGVEHGTLVVAPLFDDTTWPTGDWKDGKGRISSFAVMDALLALLVDRGRFPNIAHVTVVGHSAGAQFTQRYAALGKAPDQVSYAVANPSSYVYFDAERPGPTSGCSGFDTYKYGLTGRSGYVGELTGTQAKAQYLRRQVTLLLGGADTFDNGDLDVNCEAMAQGPHRLARGTFFHDRYPCDRVVVPGVGHDAARMFASPLSWPALFGPRSTSPVTSPAELLALNGLWKLTLPTGAPGSPTEVSGSVLASFSAGPYFRTTADSGVAFRAPVNGVTTSGSSYPRSELREMNSDGSKAAWSSTDGLTHTLTVTEAFTHLPEGKPHLVGAQIHDAADDVSVFRLEGSTLYVTSGNTTHFAVADSNYVLGTPFEAKYVVSAGKVRAYYNGTLVTTIDAAFSGAYFKAGAYTQANCTNSSPCSDANYGETVIYKLAVSHGADVLVPVPSGNGPVIHIIRHGEKPSDPNDHTLSPKGHLRAEALPSIFTGPRSDLFKPSWIFASKGDTTSMRMLQTAQPTASALGLPIDTSLDSENAITQTAQLLAKQATAGKVVLAVLEHSAIAAVASALVKTLGGSWNAKPPSSWGDSDFSSIWIFTGDGKGGWTFSKLQESVLPGDPGYGNSVPPPVPTPIPTPTPVPEVPPVTTSGLPPRGIGGIAPPPGAKLATSDTSSPVTFSSPGVYDGQGHTIGTPTLKSGVTLQNYRVVAGTQYGVVISGDDIVFRNNDVKGIKSSGDGDLNVVTLLDSSRVEISNNTIVDPIASDPGDSHTDLVQSWVSANHSKPCTDIKIVNNLVKAPANPNRDNSIASIHQFVMVEGAGRGGNSGGNGNPTRWLIADNEVYDSWNQSIKVDCSGEVDFMITRNRFLGSSDRVIDPQSSKGIKFYADNEIGPGYKSVGIPITPGAGPGHPAPTPTPVPDPVPAPVPDPVPTPAPVPDPVPAPPPVVDPPPVPLPDPPPAPAPLPDWLVALIAWIRKLFGISA